MPRQNRVTPLGTVIATPARGMLLGNRGCLHNAAGSIVRNFQLKRWIYCLLHFKDRRRKLMQPGRYTELFFLDEATALAAGHRPCAECQRNRYLEFNTHWKQVTGLVDEEMLGADDLDRELHAERLDAQQRRQTFAAIGADLPDGVMVLWGKEPLPYLLWQQRFLSWMPSGYRPASSSFSLSEPVQVLTPQTVVGVIRAGFRPDVKVGQ